MGKSIMSCFLTHSVYMARQQITDMPALSNYTAAETIDIRTDIATTLQNGCVSDRNRAILDPSNMLVDRAVD